MNKFFIIPLITLILYLCVFSSNAFSYFSKFQDASTILTLHFITPDNKRLVLAELKYYGGNSTTNPCSDLSLRRETQTIAEDPGNYYGSSDEIAVGIGTSLTCMKLIFTKKTGQVYQTGNIKLFWYDTQYTKADPNYVTFDFTQ